MKKNNEENKKTNQVPSDKKQEEKGSSLENRKEKKLQFSPSEWEDLQKKAKLAEEYYDRLLRLGAEFENARRRMQKEKEEFISFANHKLLSDLLPIVDDFERLLEGLKNNEVDEGIATGVKMIWKRLYEVLEKNGLERMKVIGEKFDPTKHEAIMVIETDEYPEDSIVEEIRSGYLLHQRVLRPAVVKVAKRKQGTEEDTRKPPPQKESDTSGESNPEGPHPEQDKTKSLG
ncbi:MAG: nucleotide exchange factor GrpE [Candidatus Omnitrophota bacterium]